MTWEFITGFLQIVIIDLTLSGDNAIVIGMAAASLPRNRRTQAIVMGGACAILLRIVLTLFAAWLIKIPLLSAIAGAVLFWVAWKLLKMDVHSRESQEERKHRSANNFKQAIVIILTADFMMSLDNVLSVAGAAHGSYLLLIIGLLISMPLLMTTGSLVSRLIDKFRWIPLLGALIVCYVGMEMILTDRFLVKYVEIPHLLTIVISIAVGLLFSGIIFIYNKRKSVKTVKSRVSGNESV
jgi:YjbE family integral membrane protein